MEKMMQPNPDSPWHEGEVEMQMSVGLAGQMDRIGRRAIQNHLGDQHRLFFSRLDSVVAATVDSRGDAWATLLCGYPGFLASPDQHSLRVVGVIPPADPVRGGLREAGAIGLLGIDFLNRRRSRVNGWIQEVTATSFDVKVEQNYGNCSQYIHSRSALFIRTPMAPMDDLYWTGDALDKLCLHIAAKCDTAFIASYVETDDGKIQVDVSHKAGPAGFIKARPDGTYVIPDYAGNKYFNTLGNILVNPRCGLTFVDFEFGDVLQMTGDGEICLDETECAAYPGAERLLRFKPRAAVLRSDALPIRWKLEPQ